MNTKTIFSEAEILLPSFSTQPDKMTKWATIACDQFTSEAEYWEKCEKLVGDAPSTLGYILPEAYLETEKEESHTKRIEKSMSEFDSNKMQKINGMIYVERTLPDGRVRHGIVGKIDLERYNYMPGSASAVRATEATVLERIPPRCAVRAKAVIELPHILVLVNDKESLFSTLAAEKSSYTVVYDFDLMLGGGHITGYALTGDKLVKIKEIIASHEKNGAELVYAIGDGNHSLAAAKAHYENTKDMPTATLTRYALCELTAVEDDSLEFEPIYRVLKNCNPDDVLDSLSKITSSEKAEQGITVIRGSERTNLYFTSPAHALTVGSLQIFIDEYIKKNPSAVCDYIHGVDSVEKLATENGTLGFIYDGIGKEELFPYVEKNGTLPRKTFSMGEAESKRYYLEARKIKE